MPLNRLLTTEENQLHPFLNDQNQRKLILKRPKNMKFELARRKKVRQHSNNKIQREVQAK